MKFDGSNILTKILNFSLNEIRNNFKYNLFLPFRMKGITRRFKRFSRNLSARDLMLSTNMVTF